MAKREIIEMINKASYAAECDKNSGPEVLSNLLQAFYQYTEVMKLCMEDPAEDDTAVLCRKERDNVLTLINRQALNASEKGLILGINMLNFPELTSRDLVVGNFNNVNELYGFISSKIKGNTLDPTESEYVLNPDNANDAFMLKKLKLVCDMLNNLDTAEYWSIDKLPLDSNPLKDWQTVVRWKSKEFGELQKMSLSEWRELYDVQDNFTLIEKASKIVSNIFYRYTQDRFGKKLTEQDIKDAIDDGILMIDKPINAAKAPIAYCPGQNIEFKVPLFYQHRDNPAYAIYRTLYDDSTSISGQTKVQLFNYINRTKG